MLVPDIFGRNVFDDFFGRPFDMPVPRNEMRTDIKETEGGYELAIDLPGVRREDIKAELRDGYMTVSAQSGADEEEKDEAGRYVRRERYRGSFSRTFFVGKDVKQEDIHAKFQDGVLTLDIPKVPEKPELPENRFIQIEG